MFLYKTGRDEPGYAEFSRIIIKKGLGALVERFDDSYVGVVERLLYYTEKQDPQIQRLDTKCLWKKIIHGLEQNGEKELAIAVFYNIGELARGKSLKSFRSLIEISVLLGTTILA